MQGPQIQVQTVPIPPASVAGANQRSKYSGRLRILGILQIILSGVSAACGLADCLVWYACNSLASAIWGGILFYLPAGILVLLTAKSVPASKGLAIAGLVMCILAALVAVVSFAIYIAAFGLNLTHLGYGGPAAADAITGLVSLAEVVIAIISAVHCGLTLNEPQITMSYQQQDQPNMYASQPPTQGAPVGYMQNPTYPPNTQNPPAYSAGGEKGGF
ncbi:uncharacterized protein LOC117304694 [Asterias rubens]|uniref:uncharacterized protein LOC117304694 n=1 Tax=Asterias rubens TaxID=7604 RepID=UPI00145563F9|nr:uncharacterized protein LOC117304694 [Asterias rubens]